MCANWFKRFKNGDFNINDEERSGRFAAVEDELQKDGEKVVENNGKYFHSINLYCINFFYCNKKIAKNRQELLHQSNINQLMLNFDNNNNKIK